MQSPWDRLASLGQFLVRGGLSLVYPLTCIACEQPITETNPPSCFPHCCEECFEQITHREHELCPRCAAPVGLYVYVEKGCASCAKLRFRFDQTMRLGRYDVPLREIVLKMKHHTGETLAERMGELWATHQKDDFFDLEIDVVVPIPLHWWRRWRRGYNQSEALARGLARCLRLPCHPSGLRRIRATPPQTRQLTADRPLNVKGAFRSSADSRLQGKTVLLVDDVFTTGSTLNEGAKELKRVGAKRVIAAALARAGNQ